MILPNPITAAKALVAVVVNIAHGGSALVSEQTLVLRDKACAGCPRRDPASNQCLECTCFLGLKAQLATEKCPLGKWPVTSS